MSLFDKKKPGGEGNPNAKLHPAMEDKKFKKGQTGNPHGRPKKKILSQLLRDCVKEKAPKELFINGMEQYANSNWSIAELIAWRLLYSAATGTRNAGLKDAVEVFNRTEGKVPLAIVRQDTPDDEQFFGLTEDEVNARVAAIIAKAAQSTAPKVIEGEVIDVEGQGSLGAGPTGTPGEERSPEEHTAPSGEHSGWSGVQEEGSRDSEDEEETEEDDIADSL